MPEKNKHHFFLAMAILFITAIAAYWNSFRVPFMLDDNHMLLNNIFITHPKYFINFFTGYVTSFPVDKGMCRPLLMLTFSFNHWLGRLDVTGYHIINFLLHIANGMLLLRLIQTIKKDITLPAAVAAVLVFLVHPINTEAVTYISSRSDLIITALSLIFLIFFVKKDFRACAILYPIALLFKESAMFLLIFVSLYICLFPHKLATEKKNNHLRLLAILAITTLLYLLYRQFFFSGTHPGNSRNIWSNILLESGVSFFYLKLFFLPTNINLLHIHPLFTAPYNLLELLPFVCVLLLFIIMLKIKNRYPTAAFGLLLFFCGMAPKFYATLKVPVAEHHFYLPSIGIYILIAIIANRIFKKYGKLFYYPLTLIVTILITLSIARNHELSSPLRTWRAGIIREPQHIGNWINYSIELKKSGDLKQARAALEKARALSSWDKDWSAAVYSALAEIDAEEKNYSEALSNLEKCLSFNPKRARMFLIYEQYGAIYETMRNYDKAIEYYEKALSINHQANGSLQSISRIYLIKNNAKKAFVFLLRALTISNNDFYTYFLLADAYRKTNDLQKAKTMLEKSISLKNDWFYSHYALSLLLINEQNPRFAQELDECLKLKADFIPALTLKREILKYINN